MSNKKKHTGGHRCKTGIMYVTLCSRKAFRVEYQPFETGEEKVRADNYSFNYFKGVRPAFERAVKARYEFEMKTFGKTDIDLSKMDEYFALVEKNYPAEKLKWL